MVMLLFKRLYRITNQSKKGHQKKIMGSKSKRRKITRNRKIDRISNMPDAILAEILSLVPTRCAVRTSVLSKRWKYLWTFITNLDVDFPLYYEKPVDGFVGFVDKVLRECKSPHIQKFRVHCDKLVSRISSSHWISEAVRRNVRELDVNVHKLDLPLTFFTCKTLTNLSLCFNSYPEFDIPDSICFPCLKNLYIHFRDFTNGITGKLFRSCPVLEDLSIHGVLEAYEKMIVDVTAPALRRLEIQLDIYNDDVEGHIFVINAPKLVYLHVSQLFLAKYAMQDISSLVEASVSVEGPDSDDLGITLVPINHLDCALELLTKLSGVKSLSLDYRIMHALHSVYADGLPKFPYLTCLKVDIQEDYGWAILPKLLENSPNLEKFIFEQEHRCRFLEAHFPELGEGFIWCEPQSTPSCLTLHLQTIEVKGFEGNEEELKMVEYLLANSEVLKTFIINSPSLALDTEVKFCRQVLNYPRSSRTCRIEFIGDFFSKF